MGRPALPITLVREWGDESADAAAHAFAGLIRYSESRNLAERYPTPEPVAVALRASEAHLWGCPTCSVGSLCPEGQQLDAALLAAMAVAR